MKLKYCLILVMGILIFACGGGETNGPEPEKKIVISITPSVVEFGELNIGSFKDLPVTITNNAESDDRLSGKFSVTGDNFSLTTNDTSFGLNPGESKIIASRFSANGDGLFTGTLVVTHNATNQTSPNQVQLVGTGNDQSSEISALILGGWQLFEAQDFDGADAKFDSAISLAGQSTFYGNLVAEAQSGRGWSKTQKRHFTTAKTQFLSALASQNIDTSTELNSRAGLVFVHHALNEFNSVIQQALQLLNADANYTFEHDNRVYHKSVRLVLTQSYFSVGNFQSAADQLDTLDPAGAPHSTEPDVLLKRIQEMFAEI